MRGLRINNIIKKKKKISKIHKEEEEETKTMERKGKD